MKSKDRISRRSFSRWWVLVLALTLTFTLVACDAEDDDDIGEVTPPTTTDPVSEAPLETAKTVVGAIGLNAAEKQYMNDRMTETASIPDPPAELPVSNRDFTELQYMIQLGEKLIRETNTHPLTAPYIPQSGLTCGSCHLDGGKKKAIASTFIGTATAFPAFHLRDGGIITLQDRINSCFMRSMNGNRLPVNSEPLLAMVSYITWLSEGIPIQMNADRPVSVYNQSFINPQIQALASNGGSSAAAGNKLYAAQCASCHGTDGHGKDMDQDGHFEVPPVWGPKSYNTGAGMAENFKGASWVQINMPPGQEFSLGNEDALAVATYINSEERPGFVAEQHLPDGGKNYGGAGVIYHYGSNFTTAERSTRVPVTEKSAQENGADGRALYASHCASCHGEVAQSTKRERSAAQIRQAIDNVAQMKNLKTLGDTDIQAIADELRQ